MWNQCSTDWDWIFRQDDKHYCDRWLSVRKEMVHFLALQPLHIYSGNCCYCRIPSNIVDMLSQKKKNTSSKSGKSYRTFTYSWKEERLPNSRWGCGRYHFLKDPRPRNRMDDRGKRLGWRAYFWPDNDRKNLGKLVYFCLLLDMLLSFHDSKITRSDILSLK